MIRHMVLWRLKDYAALAGDKARLAQLKNKIADIRNAGIPGLKLIELGLDVSRQADSSDIVLYSEFDSWEALERYQVHSVHEEFKVLFGPLRTERRICDYEF